MSLSKSQKAKLLVDIRALLPANKVGALKLLTKAMKVKKIKRI